MDKKLLSSIRKELLKNANEKTKNSVGNFFKEKTQVLGIKTPTVRKIANEYYRKVKNYSKKEIFDLCEGLLMSGYMEEAFIAYEWSYLLNKQYEKKDFKIFERWVRQYVSNWAECDTLCNHTIGEFIIQFPEFKKNLKLWTKSKSRWVKRAAAVSLILPARKGKFIKDTFEIADKLFLDSDDLVQKGYGWMLKEASKAHQKEVFNYVIKHKNKMPRTALRYAIEKMPNNLRQLAMKKEL